MDLDDVGVRLEGLEESDSLLRLLERLDGRRDNEGDLLGLLNAVAAGENE